MSIRYLMPRLLVAALAIMLMATFIPTYTFAGSKLLACTLYDTIFVNSRTPAAGTPYRSDVCFASNPLECLIPSNEFIVYEAYPDPSDGGICRTLSSNDLNAFNMNTPDLGPRPEEIPDASSVQYVYPLTGLVSCDGMRVEGPTAQDQLSEGPNEFTWTPPANDGQTIEGSENPVLVQRYQYDIQLIDDLTGAVVADTKTDQSPPAVLNVPAGGPYRWRISANPFSQTTDGTTIEAPGRADCVFYGGPFEAEAVETMMDTSGGASNVGDGFTVNRCEGLRPTAPTSVAYGPTTFFWDAPTDPSLLTAYEVRVYDPFTNALIGSQRAEDPNATNLTMDLGALMYAYNNITPLSAITWELVAYNGSSTACVLPMEGLTGNNVDFRDSPFDVNNTGPAPTEEPPTGGDTPPVEEGPPSGGYTPPVEEGPPPSGGGGSEIPYCVEFPENC